MEDILITALNRIEDYFEYRNESRRDRIYVYKVLVDMNKELTEWEEESKNG